MISTLLAFALYLGFVKKPERRWRHLILLFSVSGLVKLLEVLDDLTLFMVKHYISAAFRLITS